jgi:hypothetical protein
MPLMRSLVPLLLSTDRTQPSFHRRLIFASEALECGSVDHHPGSVLTAAGMAGDDLYLAVGHRAAFIFAAIEPVAVVGAHRRHPIALLFGALPDHRLLIRGVLQDLTDARLVRLVHRPTYRTPDENASEHTTYRRCGAATALSDVASDEAAGGAADCRAKQITAYQIAVAGILRQSIGHRRRRGWCGDRGRGDVVRRRRHGRNNGGCWHNVDRWGRCRDDDDARIIVLIVVMAVAMMAGAMRRRPSWRIGEC